MTSRCALAWRLVSPGLLCLSLGLLFGCSEPETQFDSSKPARGPSEMLQRYSQPLTDGQFEGGNDAVLQQVPEPAPAAAHCGAECQAYCDALSLTNPVNRALCPSTWGIGLTTTPVVGEEACRRLYVDTRGRYPTYEEIEKDCLGRPWGDVVRDLIDRSAFVQQNQRHWADRLRYDTEAVSVERIFDMDQIVAAVYEGRLSYDHFAAILSAHPVLTRRHNTAGDRADALFWLLLGRPPFGDERSDLGRLYHLWDNHYFDHPSLGMRLPDAFIRYRCVDAEGNIDAATAGECTSIKFGFERLILEPDSRAIRTRDGLRMWSGYLTADEWERLQAPGRLLSQQWSFWEHAVNLVLQQYLGYDIGSLVPEVTERLVRYLLAYKGDIRSVHFAVLTSVAYTQSSTGATDAAQPYLYGPLKQADAEAWVDSLDRLTGSELSRCDWRLNRPRDFLRTASPFGYNLVRASNWQLNRDGSDVHTSYRDLVRTLGGCPDNSQGGRFKIVSVLTTANQINYAARLCDPALEGNSSRAGARQILPSGMDRKSAVDADVGAQIVAHQIQTFFGRRATSAELEAARAHATACSAENCSAEEFARPACFALLSSAEMVFY